MKNILKFMVFLICVIGIFFISNFIILALLTLASLLITKGSIFSKKIVIPFIIFTVIINTISNSFNYAILIGIRLIIACNITYVFSKSMSVLELSEVIQKIMTPIKLFKINTQNISIIICIAICMIPILKDEIEQIKYSLKSKAHKIKINNLSILIKPLFISILKRTNEIEKTLISKGYVAT